MENDRRIGHCSTPNCRGILCLDPDDLDYIICTHCDFRTKSKRDKDKGMMTKRQLIDEFRE